MIAVQDLFEAHLTVTDLDRSVEFYRDVVGLQLGARHGRASGCVLLDRSRRQRDARTLAGGVGPQRMTMHIAFRVSAAEVIAAPAVLRSAGITPLDFEGQPTDEPVVIAWMPALSVFFRDH